MGKKITALRPFVLDRTRVQAGDTLEVSADEHRALLHAGVAIDGEVATVAPKEDSEAAARQTKPDKGPTQTK